MSSATHRITTLLVRARALDERVEERARAGLPCERDASEASAIRWAVDRLRPRFPDAATRADERAQEILARRTRPRLDFLASLCELLHLEPGSAPPAVLDRLRELIAERDALADAAADRHLLANFLRFAGGRPEVLAAISSRGPMHQRGWPDEEVDLLEECLAVADSWIAIDSAAGTG